MNNIKRSILALVLITGIVVVTTGCDEDNQINPTPQPEPGFIVPSGIGQPDDTCGSGGEYEGCENGGQQSPSHNNDDSRQQLF